MTPQQWFAVANPLAALGWLLLAISLFVPASGALRGRLRWVSGRALPLLLSAGYTAALVASWGSSPGGGFGSLQAVGTLFSSPGVLLAGWVHYLAFDLLVGRWAVDDAQALGLHALLVLPCLFLIFMFGPAGWLLYVVLRSTKGHRL
jgi:hypothetical protein